jgi:flagellar hook-associated protein 2
MATTTSSIFTGGSSYSQDFQNIITRAKGIASLPISQLQADQATLSDQATALEGLDSKFKALQTAVEKISKSLSGAAFQADVSDTAKVSVNLSEGAMEGNYTVDVVSAGAYASSMGSSSWVAGSGVTRDFRLSLGGVSYALAPTDNSAAAIAAAINSQYADKVRATIVNVGSSTQSDFRVSLQATKLGDLKPGLLTGPTSPTSKQTQQTLGSDTVAASRTAQMWDANAGLTFQLALNGQTHALTPADNSAQAVADAINSAYGSDVTASVVDVGAVEAPDVRISLVATGPGNVAPQILSSDGVTDPVNLQEQLTEGSDTKAVSRTAAPWVAHGGATLTYKLSLGGVNYNLTPTGNSAADVAADINIKYGDKVTAAVVDVGTGNTHDYRLTLTAVKPGNLAPDLVVSETNLQAQHTTGSLAHYIVNNSGMEVTSDSRVINIASGISVELLARDDGIPVNITVIRSTSALGAALSEFTDAYNAAVDEVDKHRGETSGALAGQSLLSMLSRSLASIATYSSSGSVDNLATLGVELDKTGHVSFNSFALLSADFSSSSGVTSFLGSSTSGFLRSAIDGLKAVEDLTTGLLPTAKSAVQAQSVTLAKTIADAQARVDLMVESMQNRMAASDALIAAMEQRYSYMAAMFQSMRTSSEQYR